MKGKKRTKKQLMQEIAELRLQVDELRASKARSSSQPGHDRLMSVLESMHNPVCIINARFGIDYINAATEQTFGSANGLRCYEYFHERTEACPWCVKQSVLAGNTVRWISISPESHRTYEVLDTPLRDADGTVSMLAILQDITEYKQAVKALHESEGKYRNVIENAPIGFFQNSLEGRFLSVNSVLARTLGYGSPAELISDITDIGSELYLFPEQRQKVLDAVLKQEGWRRFENLCFRKGRSTLTANVMMRAVRDEKGTPLYLQGFVEDVTDRKRTEEALLESEARYRTLVEQIPAITYTASLDKYSTTSYISPQVKDILGYSQEEYRVDPDLWLKRLHPEDKERVFEEVTKCHISHEPFISEYRMINRDGEVVWFRDEAAIVFNDSGQPLFLQGVMFNITASKKAGEALENQLHFLETLINTIPSPTFYKNVEGVYIGYNKAFEAFLGLSGDQIIGKSVYDLAPADLADKYHEMDLALFNNPGVQTYEASVLGADRCRHDVVFNKSTFSDSSGNVAGLIGIILDITERKQTEEALRKSEQQLRFLSSKLMTAQEEERKKVARELHDSIGSSLTAIKICLQNISGEIAERSTASDSLKTLVAITQQAIDESRRIVTDLRPSILDDLGIVATLLWFCRQIRTIYSNISIEQKIGLEESSVPEPLKIVIFRVVQEAFNNIAKYSKAKLVNVSLMNTGNAIELTIRDNGVGFDLSNVAHKETYKKGLGLSSMRERVELSGGTFFIQSLRQVGTTIRARWDSG